MTADRDHLEQLVTHPGWLLLREYARTEWGAKAYAEKLDGAAIEADAFESRVKSRGFRMAKDAVLALLAWPEEEIRRAEKAAVMPEPSMMRGGR